MMTNLRHRYISHPAARGGHLGNGVSKAERRGPPRWSPLRIHASRAKFHVIFPALVLGLSCFGFAATSAAAGAVRVGFVNVAKVMDQAPQAGQARKRIEREFAPRERALIAKQKDVRAREDRMLKNAAVMSAGERQRQEGDIRKMKRDLRREQDNFREDLNLRRSQELSKLQRRVSEVIRSLAKAQGFDLVLMDSVVYASDRVEITGQVIDRLKSEAKKSGG